MSDDLIAAVKYFGAKVLVNGLYHWFDLLWGDCTVTAEELIKTHKQLVERHRV